MGGRRLCLLWGVSLFCLTRSQNYITLSNSKQCQQPEENSIFKCDDLIESQSTGYKGKVLNCRCKSNCRKVTIVCRQGEWRIQNASMRKRCTEAMFTETQGPVHVSYSNSYYTFSCVTGYQWVNGTKVIRCIDGGFETHEAAACEPERIKVTDDNRHLTCHPAGNSTYVLCPDAPSYPVRANVTTLCTCKSNCRDLVVECKPSTWGQDGVWFSKDNVNYCASEHDNFSLGSLSVSYNCSTRSLRHSCGPGLGLLGASSTNCSEDGVVEGGRPSCRPADDTTTKSPTTTMKSTTIHSSVNGELTNNQNSTSQEGNIAVSSPGQHTIDQNDVGISIPTLIVFVMVLVLMVTILLVFIWYRFYRHAPVSTSDTKVFHNQALQMTEPPNEDDDPEYDYPVLNPNNEAPEDQECDYPELKPRPGVQLQEDNVCYAANDMYMQGNVAPRDNDNV